MSSQPAILVLEDGRVFRGRSFGAPGEPFGEVVQGAPDLGRVVRGHGNSHPMHPGLSHSRGGLG